MRASDQEQKGGIGVHEVAADFEHIGWGVVHNSLHDLGTDLFLMARDHRLIDLGMLVGAQVKAGPSWFRQEHHDGWWFYEPTRDHFDAWIDHQLPHLIVLRDIQNRVSYWAHIKPDAVRYTGQGAKILVPRANVVGAEARDRLLAVAASNAPKISLEGSNWSGQVLSPSHRLRHALLVPRLVAPHPNRGLAAAPTATEVLAMVVQLRTRQLDELRRKHTELYDLSSLPPDAAWEWRFAAGVSEYVQTGEADVLRSHLDQAGPPHEQAASTVAVAAALVEGGRVADAYELLDELLARDVLDLVDHAWVQLQRARTDADLGRYREARDQTLALADLAQRAPGDVTASAIVGAAAQILFSVSDWDSRGVETTVAASDTSASWWRQQVTGWGLAEQADQTFRTWARDAAVTLVGGDTAWRRLRSASLIANFLGDHDAWRQNIGHLARLVLSDDQRGSSDPADISAALTLLRQSGDYKGVRLASRRLVSNGPAAAVAASAASVHPEDSVMSSAFADLCLLTEAGDLLPQDGAERIALWARQTFLDSRAYTQRVHPSFLVPHALIGLLTALIDAVGDEAQEQLADFVLELPVQAEQSVAEKLAELVNSLPTRVWSVSRSHRAVARADADYEGLAYRWLAAAGPHLPTVRERLVREAFAGSLRALDSLGDVTNLEPNLVAALINDLTDRIDTQIADEAKGLVVHSIHDYGRAVTVLNLWHPQQANWEIVYRLLRSSRTGGYIDGVLRLLANLAERIPEEVAEALISLTTAVAEWPPPRRSLLGNKDARPAARRVLAHLQRRTDPGSIAHLVILAHGTVDERRTAALVAGDAADDLSVGVLLTLSGDPEPTVRATAARVITEMAAKGSAVARAHLTSLLDDSGTLTAKAIAAAVRDHPEMTASEALWALNDHASAWVRKTWAAAEAQAKRARMGPM